MSLIKAAPVPYNGLPDLRPCYYCGSIAGSVDHVPPVVARPAIIEQGLNVRLIEVPACRQCNSALGKTALWTLGERKTFIKNWIAKRYAKYLRLPVWTEEELLELGPQLSRRTRAALRTQARTRQRLAW